MPDELDDLLKMARLTPPDDFDARVLRRIAALPEPDAAAISDRVPELAEWLGVAAAVLAGISHLAAFAFSIWTVSNAS